MIYFIIYYWIFLNALQYVLNHDIYTLYKDGDIEIFSNTSDYDIAIFSKFFVFWTEITVLFIACDPPCSVSQNNANNYAILTLSNTSVTLIHVELNMVFQFQNTTEFKRFYVKLHRVPSVITVSSKFPKLRQGVQCFTDGLNKLYNFSWTCNSANEPKDLVNVEYISFSNETVTFLDTAPLIIYNCTCYCSFYSKSGQPIFEISLNVELNLKENELLNCEIIYSSDTDFGWEIMSLYVLITFTIPLIFIVIAYFVTDGRLKDTIQKEILIRLGIVNEEYNKSQKFIPYFVVSKCDLGKKEFDQIILYLREFDKIIDKIKILSGVSLKDYKNLYSIIQNKARGKILTRIECAAPIQAVRRKKRRELLDELRKEKNIKRDAMTMKSIKLVYKKSTDTFQFESPESSEFHDSSYHPDVKQIFRRRTSSSYDHAGIPIFVNFETLFKTRKRTRPLDDIAIPWKTHDFTHASLKDKLYENIDESVFMSQLKRLLSEDEDELGIYKRPRRETKYQRNSKISSIPAISTIDKSLWLPMEESFSK